MTNRHGVLATVLAILSFIFCFSAELNAQEEAKWRTIQPAKDEFSIESPVDLRFAGTKPDLFRKYIGEFDDVFYFVFSDKASNPQLFKIVSGFAASNGSDLGSANGEPRRTEVTFVDHDDFTQHIVVFRTSDRIIIAQTISQKRDDTNAARFCSSFQPANEPTELVSNPAEMNSSAPEVRESANGRGTARPSSVPSTGQGSGGGIGSGIRTGRSAVPSPEDQPPRKDASLRILAKPKPSYIDLARVYEISGVVRLRVTFLKSGQIGEVIPVKKLPFGLTGMAIKAARGIRFEPAYMNGEPVSLTKLVEYTFTIY